MNLRHIRAFGTDMDIEVKRTNGNKLQVAVINDGKRQNYTISPDASIKVKLK